MAAASTRFGRAKAERAHLARVTGPATGRLPRESQALRSLRAARRVAVFALWTPLAALVQAALLVARPAAARGFGRFYWASIARCIGLSVRVIGQPARGERPIIFVCNHSSWLDIPAVGSLLAAPFVAKEEVAAWPIVGQIARLGRTVFVSRSRASLKAEGSEFEDRLRAGDDLILFPEGTSSDGSRVLPFNSSFFAAAFGDAKPLIQPVSIVYDRLAGLPVGHASRPVFAWYGDMSLAPHAWRVAQFRGKRVTILLHRPLDPADFPNRKALAGAAWQAVADGAASLRQNRPARPLPEAAPAPVGTPALA